MSTTRKQEEAAVAAAIRSIDRSKMDDVHKQVQEERKAAGFGVGPAPTEPDIPACDCCGREYSANLVCSRCQSAFYCSKECQRAAWKSSSGGNHKHECDGMKQACQDTAEEVVSRMKNESYPSIIRVQDLDRLDCAGTYKAAVALGIHPAIQELFQDDQQHIMERFRTTSNGEQAFSSTQFIMSVLFRGQRFEGRGNATTGSFRCIDGQRIAAYVLSDDQAFVDWMNASLQVLRVPLDGIVYRNRSVHQVAHMTARDVWAAWIMVFTNRRASKTILLGGSGAAPHDDAVVERCKSIAKRIKGILTERWNASDDKDPRSTLEGILNQVAAMVSYWVREFKIPVDFEKVLGLRGAHKQMYLQMAVPLGEGTIKKGASLTNQEAQTAMASSRGGRRGGGRR